MGYAVQAVKNGSGALADACRIAAEKAVAAAKEGADSHSPGAIARMWGQEIGEYSVQKVLSGASLLVRTVRDTSRRVVGAWGSPNLGIGTNLERLNNIPNPNALQGIAFGFNRLSIIDLEGGNQPFKKENKTIIFNIGNGAFQLDARNLTQTECQKIVTLGLEGIRQVQDVNIRGVR